MVAVVRTSGPFTLTDPEQNTTTWVYDVLGRAIQRSSGGNIGVRLSILTLSGDPSPYTTASYDANGNALTQTDASGNTTAFDYDRLGRVHSVTDQNNTALDPSQQRGVTHKYTYGAGGTSAAGKVTLDAVTIPGGSTGVDNAVLSIATAYDDLGRVQFVSSYQYADGICWRRFTRWPRGSCWPRWRCTPTTRRCEFATPTRS